jgi:sugar phosphate permease
MSNASFIALLLGQILSSLQRKSFQVASPYIIKEFDYTKSNIGTISSSFSFSYGITKFVGGIKQQLFILLQQQLLLLQ